MKLIKNISLIFALTVFATSCTKWVDYDPKENYQITADQYFQSEKDYQDAVIGVYDPIQWMYLNILIGDIASDNSVSGGESATDVLGLQQIDEMTHTPINDNLTSIWKWCYEGVNRANYLVQNKDLIEFDNKEALYGEVYFLRAYYYFELVKFFGDVPLFTEYRLGVEHSGALSRSSAIDVYAQIEADLNAAIAVLPVSGATAGRANEMAARALLGRVYLYQNKFTECKTVLADVYGAYSLVPNFQDQFMLSGENGPESVFEVQYTKNSQWWDWGYVPQGTEGNFGVVHNGIRAYDGPDYASGWSFNLPTQDLFDAYEDGDSRRDATILDIVAFADANGAKYAEGYKHTGYYNNKYIPRAGQTDAQPELNYETNYRAIRYADVLLMLAEAEAELGADVAAQGYLNEVRQRAFGDTDHDITATGSGLIDAIYTERRLEFAMEGFRFFDLVRTGQAESKVNGFVSGKHELFPIPQQEIDISNLTQNNY